jgi:hypothetical protein
MRTRAEQGLKQFAAGENMPVTDQSADTSVLAGTTTVPVSGRYDGEMSLPQAGRFALDLRVDIDSALANSPVMNRVSGDFYQVFRTTLPGQPPLVSKTYIDSWIIDHPQVTWSSDHVDIEGSVRFWTGAHAATTAAIRIGWDNAQHSRSGTVTLTETGGARRSFTCHRSSESFRNLDLEMAVCASVNAQVLRPSYDTSWHDNRPSNLPQRMLSIEAAYRETGVEVSIDPNVTVIDDSAPQFRSWTVAELHDAMETHFSRYHGKWPNWALWGLLAGSYEDSAVGGIMFDAAAAEGGESGTESSERRGFAVFRRHSWFDHLIAGGPQTQEQAAAMRQFLYTWVHESGHAFNFLHSWDKARPDSLSWMNYDWRYDQRNGADSFWQRFAFRFDDDELIHLRHGNRASVIMGGDPWSSGSHLEAPNLAMAQIEGDPPLELVIRAQPYFELMEPVLLEVRLRNLLTNAPVVVEKRLAPEYGGVIVHIQKPDDRVVKYDPVVCAVGSPKSVTLAPSTANQQGEDRFSRDIFLTYGASGFYFDQPGEYRIRAIYQGHGDLLVTSNTLRIRIGTPVSQEANRLAQDYFSDQVGLGLYLQGSRSPFLKKGVEFLHDLTDRYKDSLLGANTAIALAQGISRPFFRVADPQSQKMVMTAKADPKEALKLTDIPLKVLRERRDKLLNLAYARVVRRRAEYHEAAGTPGKAKNELSALQRDLADRGANATVIKSYAALEESVDTGKPKSRPKSRRPAPRGRSRSRRR